MIDRSTLIHLRFPFSFFLAPVCMFGLTEASLPLNWKATALIFIVLHGLIYPASNGFNSFYDRDEGSIGGIKHPPPVTENLLVWSLLMDGVAITVAAFVSPWFALTVFAFGLLSKAYSWDRVRLKRRPVFSWMGIGTVQGGLTFFSVALFAGGTRPPADTLRLWTGAAAISLFFLAGYPLTQVYQHEEDRKRGDRTVSMLLGIRGTFILCAAMFALAAVVFFIHYGLVRGSPRLACLFAVCQVPLVAYFFSWARQAWKNPAAADFRHAMAMNLLSAIVMNSFFVGILLAS